MALSVRSYFHFLHFPRTVFASTSWQTDRQTGRQTDINMFSSRGGSTQPTESKSILAFQTSHTFAAGDCRYIWTYSMCTCTWFAFGRWSAANLSPAGELLSLSTRRTLWRDFTIWAFKCIMISLNSVITLGKPIIMCVLTYVRTPSYTAGSCPPSSSIACSHAIW